MILKVLGAGGGNVIPSMLHFQGGNLKDSNGNTHIIPNSEIKQVTVVK